ncbi:MAG: hypothetical protein ACYCTI_00055 [Acidimicrobiales bacterium]
MGAGAGARAWTGQDQALVALTEQVVVVVFIVALGLYTVLG